MSTAAHASFVPRPWSLTVAVALALGGAGLAGCDDTTLASKGIASPSLAILASDYSSSSVSLYNPATGKLSDGCVTSATPVAQKLSGNVYLPTQPQTGGELVIIDSGAAVLTFVQPTSCTPRGQLSVSTGGFKAYPHDVVTLSATKAYVTRYDTNLSATLDPADFDDGDDLLIVDPTHLKVTGRIGLSTYATPGPTGETTQARPDRALLANGLVYVSINNISGSFGATGAGRVLIVDPATDTVTGMIDLPDQKNCSGLDYVDATKRLYVACGGAFSEPQAQVAESALVEVDLSGATPVVGRSVPAAAFGTGGLNFFYAAVSGDTAFIGTLGALPDSTAGTPGTPDAFYAAPLGGGAPVKVADGATGDLGAAIVDPTSHEVFLPDASSAKPVIHVFDGVTGAALPASDFEPNPSTHLPPRAAARY